MKRSSLALICCSILFSALGTQQVNAAIWDAHIQKNPPAVKTLTIYLIDLSDSLDPLVVTDGVQKIANDISRVYDSVQNINKDGATAYFQWVPIYGSTQRMAKWDLFTAEIDKQIWDAVASNTSKGKVNQEIMMNKIRRSNGAWNQVMSTRLDKNCPIKMQNLLNSPGTKTGLARSSNSICSSAFKTQNNVNYLQKVVTQFSRDSKLATGSDILGAIHFITENLTSTGEDEKFSKINLQFISDMQQNSPSIKFNSGNKDFLLKPIEQANRFALKSPQLSSKYKVSIYGLSEFKDADITDSSEKKKKLASNEEILKPAIREFWRSFFNQIGVSQISYGLTSEFISNG